MKYASLIVLWTSSLSQCLANVIINEVAEKGSAGVCNGEDWIEIYLPTSENSVNLEGYILHDDKGPDDEDAFVFPSLTMYPNTYALMCNNQDDDDNSPKFGIGGTDTITLRSPDGTIISTTGELPGSGLRSVDVTYAFNDDDGAYEYTSTATPGAKNRFTKVPTKKEILIVQNAQGVSFFNMNNKGLPVIGGFDDIVDLRMTMKEEDYQDMLENQSYELYSDFESVIVTNEGKPDDILYTSKSPGRIRPRGQSTLHFGTCFGITCIPFLIDFTSEDDTQTLFGVERVYLRSHFADFSYIRDWAVHRMLARFGLPHLRARHVRFFVNGQYLGLYTLMEAVDQNYVFYRSFPDFDVENYALYKVKTNSIGCGAYSETQLATARSRIDETSTPPYSYERGEHRPKVEYVGNPFIDSDNAEAIITECYTEFDKTVNSNFDDVVLAYVRGEEDCGKMLIDEGLIDRDLGDKEWNDIMGEFINKHLGPNQCQPGCVGNDLASDVDVDDFLKNFAVYAVMTNMDSPMGNGNNYYLANTGDRKGWKIVQWDHNNAMSANGADLCNSRCAANLLEWSIVRPTCTSFETTQLVGPLLSNERYHKIYLQYVEEFIELISDYNFLNYLRAHTLKLRDAVPEDPWSAVPYLFQMSLDSKYWDATIQGKKIDPFLPILVGRIEAVEEQLNALKKDEFPHSADEIPTDKLCVSWKYVSCERIKKKKDCDKTEGCVYMKNIKKCVDKPDGPPDPAPTSPSTCTSVTDEKTCKRQDACKWHKKKKKCIGFDCGRFRSEHKCKKKKKKCIFKDGKCVLK